jgi:excinuclease ABC subunit B
VLERRDVIVVASVSCIYGLGSPEAYQGMLLDLEAGLSLPRQKFLNRLVEIQYERNDVDFHRGTFRVRGDTVEVFPAYEDERAVRIEFFGDEIESMAWIDPLRGRVLEKVKRAPIYPNSHYVTPEATLKQSIQSIQDELRERIQYYRRENRLVEAQRIEQRTMYDIEMIQEMGFCKGIENYSRHLTQREPGAAPPTLLEYFPKDFVLFVDESHLTIPQVGAMYEGDKSRKLTLVDYGFRLPSALDNRPLKFEEFMAITGTTIYVSATPGPFELQKSGAIQAEQVIRPTGLLDPVIEVRPATTQVDDLLGEIRRVVAAGFRVLVTTLTKRMAENLAQFYGEHSIRVKYLHSDIDTMERVAILRDLRLGTFDVLIGINLLREGLDLPEVALVAVMDADKEGFLRSERSLIQTFGRAARNSEGRVICYADKISEAMRRAIGETERRREKQILYNREHNITPKTVVKSIESLLPFGGGKTEETSGNIDFADLSRFELPARMSELKKAMKKAAGDLDFEEAARLRDEIKRLRDWELKHGSEA